MSHHFSFKSALAVFWQTFSRLMAWIVAITIIFWILGSGSAKLSLTPRMLVGDCQLEILPNHQMKYASWHDEMIWQIDILGQIGSEGWRVEKLREQFAYWVEQKGRHNLRAIFLNIDSPGGHSAEAMEIFSLIEQMKRELNVPVYAYVNSLCASASYLLASSSKTIYASQSAIVGSVGAMYQAVNVSSLLDKVGVKVYSRSFGESKTQMDPSRSWNEEDFKDMDRILHHTYELFLQNLSHQRPHLTISKLREEIGAHVFNANEAEELGLIDKIGISREEVLSEIASELGLGNYGLVRFLPKASIMQQVFQYSSHEKIRQQGAYQPILEAIVKLSKAI